MATVLKAQTEEIASLKDSFDGQVKIISNIGDFSHVVTLVPPDTELQVKFQLTSDYPNTKPTIIIRCKYVTTGNAVALTSHLDQKAESRVSESMMTDLMVDCLQWLKDNEIDITSKQCNKKDSGKKSGKGKHSTGKKHSQRKIVEEPDQFVKKPPMKTAADVIKRLQWDQGIDKDLFIVGYMDRLTGLEEKAFTMFTWEDLASVDMFCLAIPQHRIQYFKYKDEKVWDKNERLDNVFGSTGSNVTIVETVQKYENRRIELEKAQTTEETDATEKSQTTEETDATEKSQTTEETDATEKSHTTEETDATEKSQTTEETDATEKSHTTEETDATEKSHTTEETDATWATSDEPVDVKNKKEFEVMREEETSDRRLWDDDWDQQQQSHQEEKPLEQRQQKKRRSKRPNFFAAVEIHNVSLVEALAAVQKDFLKVYPQYADYAIGRNGFHLTLGAYCLQNTADIAKCKQIIEGIKSKITEIAQRAENLTFRGLDHFSSKVVFAKVNCARELREIANLVNFTLQDEGFDVDASFTPHLTLFKVSRSDFRDPSWRGQTLFVSNFANQEFGNQSIDNIQICKMGTLPSEEEATEASSFYRNVVKIIIDKEI